MRARRRALMTWSPCLRMPPRRRFPLNCKFDTPPPSQTRTYAECAPNCAQALFLNPLCGAPTTPMPTDLITGSFFSTRTALNGSSWEPGAGATVANRSGGFITARSLECAFICTPINGWQPPNNPTVKTFNSAFDVGLLIVHLRADHLINIIMQVANCGLTLLMWLGRADAFRRAMPTPHCPMPFYSALYHPASGIPTNWACCVIRSSWGSAETGLVQWEATLAEALCAIRAEALWVLRTPAAGFHTRRGALRGYGAPAVGFTSGPPDCCHLRPARTRCKSLNLCVLWGTWLELASDSDGVALEARGWLSLLLFVPDLTLSALHGESPIKKKKERSWTRVRLLVEK